MSFSILHNKEKIFINFIVLIFVSSIMFWDITLLNFNLKYSIVLLFPFLVFEIFRNNNTYKYLIYILIFFLLINLHFFFSFGKDIESFFLLNKIELIKIVYLCYILFCVLVYFPIIQENKKKFIDFFLLVFFATTFLSLIFFKYDDLWHVLEIQSAPYFCGGIPDIFNFTKLNISGEYKLSFRHLLYKENSHFGMVITPIIIFVSIYYLNFKEKIKLFLYSTFLLICFINSSATLLMGLIVSLFVLIFIFIIKKNNKIVGLTLLFIISISIFSTSSQCTQRIVSLYNLYYDDIYLDRFVGNPTVTFKSPLKVSPAFRWIPEAYVNSGENLSSEVNVYAVKVVLNGLKKKPFGYGFDKYNQAYGEYLLKPQNDFSWRVEGYNKQDGGNNLIKLTAEFGFLSLIIYLILFLYAIDAKIRFENKVFFLSFVLTQLMRGAGYFNAGFSIVLMIIIVDFFRTNYADIKDKLK